MARQHLRIMTFILAVLALGMPGQARPASITAQSMDTDAAWQLMRWADVSVLEDGMVEARPVMLAARDDEDKDKKKGKKKHKGNKRDEDKDRNHDEGGNTGNAGNLPPVTDTTPPVIVAPASVTVEATGVQTSVNLGTATATDNIDGTVPVTSNAPASFPLGTTTVTYTATDAAGNTATAIQTVTVVDKTAPVILAPAAVTLTSSSGNPVSGNIGQAIAADAFGVTITNDAPATFPVGTTTVTWTATDANGNASTATQLVTVTLVDTVAPVVTAPAAITIEATGTLTTVNLGTATAVDNVDGSLTPVNNAPVGGFPLGVTTVTWTATDAAGNTGTATQVVTVTDTTPPTITLNGAATVTVEAGSAYADAGATASDLVNGDLTAALAVTGSVDTAVPGTYSLTYTVSDAAGNAAIPVVRTVTVVDTTAPVITVPAAVTLTSSNGNPVSGNIGQATATDLFAVTITNDAPATFPVGTTTVTWTATDANGNASTATQLVTVTLVDTVAPVVTAPAAITIEATGTLTTVNLGTATAVDNVDGSLTPVNNAPVGGFPLGVTTVTWSATDAAGNTATAVQTVTVVDKTAPVILAPAAVTLTSSNSNPVSGNIGQATATDLFAVTITNDAPATFPVGTTTVTWTATDANGNTSTATQLVTVNLVDTTPPLITVPADVTVEATGARTSVNIGTATATDNVDGTVPVTSDAPAAFPLGVTNVIWTAKDAAGNQATAMQKVTVVDTTPPVITAPAAVTASSGNNQPVAVNIGQASATDIFSVTISNDAPATFPVGTTTVTWTATDANGNTTTATQLVTVSTQPPPAVFTFTAPPDLVLQSLDGKGIPAGQVNFGTPTVQSQTAVQWNRSNPNIFPIGVSQVTWTATDANGNTLTATQKVTVVFTQDATPPVITAPADAQLITVDGNPVAASIGQAVATDNSGAVTVTNNAPAMFPVGTTTVTWTARDMAGNTATATQLVTVTWDQTILTTLPPDPGPAGKATLAGIDSDGDGVRDDVQRWIALTFPNSQKTRAALRQRTKTMQLILLDAADPVKSLAHAKQMSRAISCLSYILSRQFYNVSMEQKAVFLNTYNRSKAWMQADQHLSGTVFNALPYNQRKQGCNFNPDAMPN